MSNSDYLIKATVKKISERLNKTFIGKVEEAANVAQEVPEMLKKEIEDLKDEIIQEAKRLEEIESDDNLREPKASINPQVEQSLKKNLEIKLSNHRPIRSKKRVFQIRKLLFNFFN